MLGALSISYLTRFTVELNYIIGNYSKSQPIGIFLIGRVVEEWESRSLSHNQHCYKKRIRGLQINNTVPTRTSKMLNDFSAFGYKRVKNEQIKKSIPIIPKIIIFYFYFRAKQMLRLLMLSRIIAHPIELKFCKCT